MITSTRSEEVPGVMVTLWVAVPTGGAVAGAVNAKAPGTEAAPPSKVELASVWPVPPLR